MQQAAQQGLDHFRVLDFVNERGLCELRIGNVRDNMANPSFTNVLKMAAVQSQRIIQEDGEEKTEFKQGTLNPQDFGLFDPKKGDAIKTAQM